MVRECNVPRCSKTFLCFITQLDNTTAHRQTDLAMNYGYLLQQYTTLLTDITSLLSLHSMMTASSTWR